jgi:hypothetical protein
VIRATSKKARAPARTDAVDVAWNLSRIRTRIVTRVNNQRFEDMVVSKLAQSSVQKTGNEKFRSHILPMASK